MEAALKTKFVFIDTSVFERHNFAFSSPPLSQFLDLCKMGELVLLMPEITKREIDSRIRKRVSSAVTGIHSAQHAAKIFRNLDEDVRKRIIPEIESEAVATTLIKQFHTFTKEAPAQELEVSMINLPTVLDAYFEARPPFKEGKKRHEFPDAFSMSALQRFTQEQKGSTYVVSQDEDIAAVCETESLFHLETELSAVLAAYYKHTEALVPIIEQLFEQNLAWIEKAVGDELKDAEFDVRGKDIESIENVDIRKITIEEADIIEVTRDRAVYNLEISFTIRAELQWTEYDGEEYPPDSASETRELSGTCTASVALALSPDRSEIQSLHPIIEQVERLSESATPFNYYK
jgi:hypothetical protein